MSRPGASQGFVPTISPWSTQMAAEEKPKSRSVIRWFPRLFLWGSVLAFGYLYWDSLEQEKRELAAADEAAVPAPQQADSTMPATQSEAVPSPSSPEVAAAEPVAVVPAAPEAESEAEPAVAPVAAAPEVAAEVVEDAAGASAPEPAEAAAQPAPSPVAAQAPVVPHDPFAAHQARLAAHHAAMQRLAQERMERMQQRWAQRPVVWPHPPMPHAPPLMPPFGYAPPVAAGEVR